MCSVSCVLFVYMYCLGVFECVCVVLVCLCVCVVCVNVCALVYPVVRVYVLGGPPGLLVYIST